MPDLERGVHRGGTSATIEQGNLITPLLPGFAIDIQSLF
jgi:hypothetical protein